MSTLDDLLTGGGKSLKFETPGDTYTGTITNVTVRQMTEFGTGKLLTWDDGKPQEQIVITLDTDLRDPADPTDEGARSAYIKAYGVQLRAFRAAVAKAGSGPAPGDKFTVTYTGNGERSAQGGYPPKLYAYEIVKGAGAVDAIVGTPTQTPEQRHPASAPAGESIAEKVQALIGTGLTDTQIQQITGADLAVITAIRGSATPF